VSRVALFPFVSGGVLAHLGACVSVGAALRERGHEVFVGVDEPQQRFVEAAGLTPVHVTEIEQRRNDPNRFGVYKTVEEVVETTRADTEIIARLAPDAAVVDVRVSAKLACETLGIPSISLMHQLAWSERWRAPSPWRRRAQWIRRPLRAAAFIRVLLDPDPLGIKVVQEAWRGARAELGLPAVSSFYETGYAAVCTTPLLDPAADFPENWRWVGPITWSAPAGAAPERRDRPLVYVTQGSTGDPHALRRVVSELAGAPVDVLVSTGGLCDPFELQAMGSNVRAERLVHGRAAMEAADVAVVHGGHLTTLEAHLAATPTLVIPLGYDQFLWADRVERLGTGTSLREPYLRGAVRRSVMRLLRRKRYRRAVRLVADDLARWDGPAAVADFAQEIATP
jgi:UDP:flavonoid glycosyltransferase YjiC (YdhE family)